MLAEVRTLDLPINLTRRPRFLWRDRPTGRLVCPRCWTILEDELIGLWHLSTHACEFIPLDERHRYPEEEDAGWQRAPDEPAEDDDTTHSWHDPADDRPVQPDNTYEIEASRSAQAPSRAAGRRGTTDDVVTGSVVPAGAAPSVGRGS